MVTTRKGIELNQAFVAVLVVVLLAILVIVAITIFQSLSTSFDTESDSSSQTILSESTDTLSPIGSGITSSEVKANNLTWLDFEVNNNVVELENNLNTLDFDADGNYTYIATVNTSTTSRRSIFSQGNHASKGISFVVATGVTGGIGLKNINDQTIWRFTGPITGIMSDVACVYIGLQNYTQCYVDGQPTSVQGNNFDWDDITSSSNTEARLGKVDGDPDELTGSIESVKVFDRALSSIEINDINQARNPTSNYSLNSTQATINQSSIYIVNDSLTYALNGTDLIKSLDKGNTWDIITTLDVSGGFQGFFMDSRGTLFYSKYRNSTLFYSIGNDTNWTSTIPFSCLNESGEGFGYVQSNWAFTETFDGSLLIGEYSDAFDASVRNCSFIHKSTDGGVNWNVVYNSTEEGFDARHIHLTRVDPNTGYIYATQGDDVPASRLLRSIDNGDTWQSLQNGTNDAQYVSLVFTDTYRIFGTDSANNNKIVRTSDDVNFETVYVLPTDSDGWFWDMKRDDLTGYILSTKITKTASGGLTSLFISPDNGSSWFSTNIKNITGSTNGTTDITTFYTDGNGFYWDKSSQQSIKFNFIEDPTDIDSSLWLNLNENNGTVVHDVSGNLNNGNITLATWATDGILNTLTAITDYTINPTTGLFTIVNDDFIWAEMTVSWTYIVTSSASSASNSMINQFATYPALIGLVGTIIFLGLVIGILVVSFVFGGRKDKP